ncbi:MAG: hypothetical protein V4541_03110 [Bacteroidota bacterium]
MKNKLIILALTLLYTTVNAQNNYFELYTDSTALKIQNDALILDFEIQIKRFEPSFSFNGLTTEIPNNFMPGQYTSKTNKIYLNTWQVGGPPMESFLTEITGSKESGQQAGALFFYGFFLPHEIGHGLHFQTDNVPKNNYDSEYEANEIAVSYWRSKGKQKELQQCYVLAKKILSQLKNPIPENTDEKEYITAHYKELMNDPYKYGYIQFSQIVKILEDKSLPKFEKYIKKYFKNKSNKKKNGR